MITSSSNYSKTSKAQKNNHLYNTDMAIRPIITYPSPILRQPSKLIETGGINTEPVKQLMVDLMDTMYSMPAYGVAAIQIGVPLQMFILDTAWDHTTGENQNPKLFMNPVIISEAEPEPFEEGCLSIPGGVVNNIRSKRVLLQYMNTTGETVIEDFEGLAAIAIQHEVEHLQGKLFIDGFGPIKQGIVFKRSKKYLKNLKRYGR